MPQAKPTQVIVHRFELQTSERKYLEEIIEKQNQDKLTIFFGYDFFTSNDSILFWNNFPNL